MKNPDRKLFVIEENGNLIGSIRADYSEDVCELSWSIDKDSRGRGVAKQMVAKIMNQINKPVCAEIKNWNIPSIHIAKYVGMKLKHENNGILYYGTNN